MNRNNFRGTKQCDRSVKNTYMCMYTCTFIVSIDLGLGILATPRILLRKLHPQNTRTVGPGLRQAPPRHGRFRRRSRRLEAERRLRRHREATRAKAALGQPHSRLFRYREYSVHAFLNPLHSRSRL